jgi:hypothetical protein
MKMLLRPTAMVAGLMLLAAPTAPESAPRDAGASPSPQEGQPGRPGLPPGRQGPPGPPRTPPTAGGWIDEKPFTRSVKLGTRGTLDVNALFGDVAITGIDGDMVRISATKRVRETNREYARMVLQNVRVQITERGGGVEVLTEIPEGKLPPLLVDYVIGVPLQASVSLRSWGGEVRVANIKGELRAEKFAAGDMTLSSVGRIRLAKSVAANVIIEGAEGDDVEAETLVGRLQVRDVRARTVELNSVNGPIVATDVSCDRCALNSVSGAIEFSGPLKADGRYTMYSNSGDIRLFPTGPVGFDLEAIAGGNLVNELPFKLKTDRAAPAPGTRQRVVRAVSGNGSAILSVRTVTGNISILKKP